MANTVSYNLRSPAVKRLLQEARELQQDKCSDYNAQPLEDNLFEWHFVIRGPDGTEFEGGRYHGRILLPSEYPFKPPNLMLMTPNGRFELNKKICLSITGYHPEYWLPAWGIRTVLLGLLGFMTTKSNGAIGGIDYSESERKILAQRSRNWKCITCDLTNIETLPDDNNKSVVNNDSDVPQFSFVYEEQKKPTQDNSSKNVIALLAKKLS
ncbi:12147_t:CDS:2 [Funneliformis mosseae]|uniref:12147_t:CDS:1 n=1 Tax=Funneliformis mosseae TaxID=27381 RepID=A0A9N8WAY7_FUNMO|nr:12147_t:CDS:2 [Funneliformis mosseae]